MHYALYHITLRTWPLLTITIDLIGQSIIVCVCVCSTYIVYYQTITFILSLHPPSFNIEPPCFQWVVTGDCFECHASACLKKNYHTLWHFDCIYYGSGYEYSHALPVSACSAWPLSRGLHIQYHHPACHQSYFTNTSPLDFLVPYLVYSLVTMICVHLCPCHIWVKQPIMLNWVFNCEYILMSSAFIVCSLRRCSVGIGDFQMCFVLCVISWPVFVALTLYHHPLWSALLSATITLCIHSQPSSLCMAAVDCTGKEIETLWISLPFKYLSCYDLRVS